MNTIRKSLAAALSIAALSASLPVLADPGQGYDVVGSHAVNIGVGEMVPGMPNMGITMAGQGWDAFGSHAYNIGVAQSISAPSQGYIGTAMEGAPTRGFNLFRTGETSSL